jgi:hypothetical protein
MRSPWTSSCTDEAQMPEMDELRVLQTGGDEGAFDALDD